MNLNTLWGRIALKLLTFCLTISIIYDVFGGSRMSDETNKKLKEYAATHNLSMTEVALRSLEEYLSKKK